MKKIYVLGFLFSALIVFQGVASAKVISGKIDTIDAAANKLSVTDPTAGPVDILVSATTTYTGVTSLADLKAGQEVSVEASEGAAGLSAASVKLAEAPREVIPVQVTEPEAKEPAM